jgi:SAM-dependent methyltransferase
MPAIRAAGTKHQPTEAASLASVDRPVAETFQHWQRRGRSFGPVADCYDRIRPNYPVDALRWIVGDAPLRVVDLGAGTGILSRQLRDLGHDVVAIEPDIGMLRQLKGRSPGVGAVAGVAEAIPLRTGYADAVVAGQAYHWFDLTRANGEVARILKPGGVVGALWNDRDSRVSWAERLDEIADDLANQPLERNRQLGELLDFGPLFAVTERQTFEHSTRHTVDSLVELMKSRSYYLTSPPEAQVAIVAAIRDLAATHPALAGRNEFDLPYVTMVFRGRRL